MMLYLLFQVHFAKRWLIYLNLFCRVLPAQTSLKLNQQLLIAGGSAPTEKYVPANSNNHEARSLSSAATFGGETTYTGRK